MVVDRCVDFPPLTLGWFLLAVLLSPPLTIGVSPQEILKKFK
jgi:hypothetical protein